jgi:hypothetical protein
MYNRRLDVKRLERFTFFVGLDDVVWLCFFARFGQLQCLSGPSITGNLSTFAL